MGQAKTRPKPFKASEPAADARPEGDEQPASQPGEQAAPSRWQRLGAVSRVNLPARGVLLGVGAAALIAGGTAIALVASGSPSPHPTPAGYDSSTPSAQNALAAIIAKNQALGQPIPDLVRNGTLPTPAYVGDNGRVGGLRDRTAPMPASFLKNQYLTGPVNGAYTLVQLASLALSTGCSQTQARIAGAIAAAESGGDPGAQGDISLMDGTWDWSAGLWQIRGLRSERGTGGLRDSIANADPRKNAQAMRIISSGCTNWTPWSTYNTGAYLPYMGLMGQAVHAATVYHGQTGAYPPVGPGDAQEVTVPRPTTSTQPTRSHKRPVHKKHRPTGSTSGQPAPARSSSAPSGGGGGSKSTTAQQPGAPVTTSKAPAPPVKLPTVLPTKLPTALPTKLPTKLPTTLPVPLPSVSVPGLPGLP